MGKTLADDRSRRPSDPEAHHEGHEDRCFPVLSLTRALSFRCVFVLLLTVASAISGFLWLPPFVYPRSHHAPNPSHLALIEASFTLHKPISFISPYTARLEYDIFEEIGVPNTKVSVITMQPLPSTNSTRVIFGVIPDKDNVAIDSVSKSLLKSSFVELMLQQSNLSLTESIFGQPSSFNILKFPGGISVIPVQPAPLWQITKYLFSFTLNNSITDILRNLDELKGQMKVGLHLKSYENVFVRLLNPNGSTVDPPVTVQASILSDVGSRILLPPRLKQLAEFILGSAQNLGLNHTLFGKVGEVVLSQYLNNSIILLESPSPAPSPLDEFSLPGPPPFPNDQPASSPSYLFKPPSPKSSSSYPPLRSPSFPPELNPCLPSMPTQAPSPIASDAPLAPSTFFQSPLREGENNDYSASLASPMPLTSSAESNFLIHFWTAILGLLLLISCLPQICNIEE